MGGQGQEPRWHRPYTELVYQPMQEVLGLLRANGFRTYIVSGGGQAFVRSYAEDVYGIAPEEVIGSALEHTATTPRAKGADPRAQARAEQQQCRQGRGHLPVHRPAAEAAFGNSTGDRQMLEWATAGSGSAWACWSCTTTRSASTPTARPRACRTPRSARSPRRCHDEAEEARLGRGQHEERLEADLPVRRR